MRRWAVWTLSVRTRLRLPRRTGLSFRSNRARVWNQGDLSGPACPPPAGGVEIRVLRRLPAHPFRLRGRIALARQAARHRLFRGGVAADAPRALRSLIGGRLDHDACRCRARPARPPSLPPSRDDRRLRHGGRDSGIAQFRRCAGVRGSRLSDRLRRDLPGLWPRLLWLLRAGRDPEHRGDRTRVLLARHDGARYRPGLSQPSTRLPRRFGKKAKLMANRTIRVDYIARVEGESSLELHVRNGAVDAVRLSIFEPPRFFEALLRGRGYEEVLDIVARICGICPIAYQMSGVHAVENALGIKVDPPIRALRRLFYCGEWIQSHALHIVMLHAPDFLGYPDAIAMAREHGDAVERALALKKRGNELIRLLGGREIHPINVRIGGFYRVPSRAELAPVAEALKHARDQAIDTLRWAAGFPFPECVRDYEFVALRHATNTR